MGKCTYTFIDYESILENNITNGNMFVEKIKTKDNNNIYCVFSVLSEQNYIFWKQHPQGNVYINIGSKEKVSTPGFITFIGKSLCEAYSANLTLSEYFNKII